MREQVDRLQKLTTELLDLTPRCRVARARARTGAAADTCRPGGRRVRSRGSTQRSPDRGDRQRPRPGGRAIGRGSSLHAERVAQILRVLLDNALTHAGEEAQIEVNASRTDSAPGHPAERLADRLRQRPRYRAARPADVFDRFHSGNNTQGTGLGLAIARELAERMLGRLEVSLTTGKHCLQARVAARRRRVGIQWATATGCGHRGEDRHVIARLVALAVAALLLGLAGCGGGDDGGSTGTRTVETTKVQVVEGDSGRQLRRRGHLSPSFQRRRHGRSIFGSAEGPAGCALRRGQRVREAASCSTTKATSPRTHTSSPKAGARTSRRHARSTCGSQTATRFRRRSSASTRTPTSG